MGDYTPTTKRVRDAYVRAMRNAFIASAAEHEDEFNRWFKEQLDLARDRQRKVDAKIAEEVGQGLEKTDTHDRLFVAGAQYAAELIRTRSNSEAE